MRLLSRAEEARGPAPVDSSSPLALAPCPGLPFTPQPGSCPEAGAPLAAAAWKPAIAGICTLQTQFLSAHVDPKTSRLVTLRHITLCLSPRSTRSDFVSSLCPAEPGLQPMRAVPCPWYPAHSSCLVLNMKYRHWAWIWAGLQGWRRLCELILGTLQQAPGTLQQAPGTLEGLLSSSLNYVSLN